MLKIQDSKDKIAIVVVGYNRVKPLKRLLTSLEKATYPSDEIPLVISIDASGMQELYTFVESFHWSHGPKYTIIEKERLGLRTHILHLVLLRRTVQISVMLRERTAL